MNCNYFHQFTHWQYTKSNLSLGPGLLSLLILIYPNNLSSPGKFSIKTLCICTQSFLGICEPSTLYMFSIQIIFTATFCLSFNVNYSSGSLLYFYYSIFAPPIGGSAYKCDISKKMLGKTKSWIIVKYFLISMPLW